MHDDLASRFDKWDAAIEYILDYREEIEVSTALVYRDELHETITREPVPDELARSIEAVDTAYAAMRAVLAKRFPDVYSGRAPRDFWWWWRDEPRQPLAAEQLVAAG